MSTDELPRIRNWNPAGQTLLACHKCGRPTYFAEIAGRADLVSPSGRLHVCATIQTGVSPTPAADSVAPDGGSPVTSSVSRRSLSSAGDEPVHPGSPSAKSQEGERRLPPGVILSKQEYRIWQTLPLGRRRARPQREVAGQCGMKEHEFRQTVEDMRQKRVPVCSSSQAGVWYPETLAEAVEVYDELRRRIRTQAQNARAMRRGAEQMFAGQEKMFDDQIH